LGSKIAQLSTRNRWSSILAFNSLVRAGSFSILRCSTSDNFVKSCNLLWTKTNCGWVHHLYSFMKVEKSCKRGSDVLITFSRDGGSNVSPSVGTDLLSSDPRILHMQAGIPFESTRRLASPHNKHISPFSLWNPFVFDLRHHGQHKEPIVSFCENSKAQNCEAHPPKCCHNA
jgi:hypothetical protein